MRNVLSLHCVGAQGKHHTLSVKSKAKHATFLEPRVTAGRAEVACLATFSLPNHATSLSPCGLSGNGQILMTPHPLWWVGSGKSELISRDMWALPSGALHLYPTRSCGLCASWAALEVKGKNTNVWNMRFLCHSLRRPGQIFFLKAVREVVV